MALKSSYEIAMEKMEKMGIPDAAELSSQDKARIADIRSEYEAKIAEKKILLKDAPELPDELQFLDRERERKIKEIYEAQSK
ncbi:MAG: hypothetical protein GY868_12105 [Deltaproteobacteria bacterium]|nr:hypothetical protein [Deltaproteobacteria bacterium]